MIFNGIAVSTKSPGIIDTYAPTIAPDIELMDIIATVNTRVSFMRFNCSFETANASVLPKTSFLYQRKIRILADV